MNLLQIKIMNRIEHELALLLDHCISHDEIVGHFSQYLLGQLVLNYVDDYDFFPNVSASGIEVTVYLYFIWDNKARHEFTLVKNDSPDAAYTRAMGVI